MCRPRDFPGYRNSYSDKDLVIRHIAQRIRTTMVWTWTFLLVLLYAIQNMLTWTWPFLHKEVSVGWDAFFDLGFGDRNCLYMCRVWRSTWQLHMFIQDYRESIRRQWSLWLYLVLCIYLRVMSWYICSFMNFFVATKCQDYQGDRIEENAV